MPSHRPSLLFSSLLFTDPTHTKKEGISQEYEHQKEWIVKGLLKISPLKIMVITIPDPQMNYE